LELNKKENLNNNLFEAINLEEIDENVELRNYEFLMEEFKKSETKEKKEKFLEIIELLKSRIADIYPYENNIVYELKISAEILELSYNYSENTRCSLFRAYRAFETLMNYGIYKRYAIDLVILDKLTLRTKQNLLYDKIGSNLEKTEYNKKKLEKFRNNRNEIIHGFDYEFSIINSIENALGELWDLIEGIITILTIINQTNPI